MVAVVDIKLHCLRSPARGEKVRNDEMGFTGQERNNARVWCQHLQPFTPGRRTSLGTCSLASTWDLDFPLLCRCAYSIVCEG